MRLFCLAVAAQTLSLIRPSISLVLPAEKVELTFEDSASSWSTRSAQHEALVTRQTADDSCTNGPDTRACWYDGYSVATDFDLKWPETGRTVTYDLEITNTTLAPDGVERLVLAIDGQYPGPTLYGNWGDTLIVNVKNSLQDNVTSMHWHGLRQLDMNQYDGVNGITECPLAPGQSKQYIIRCTQHATSWYHSHYTVQYGDGVLGAIVINGPASANYDEDLGTLTFTDWYHHTAFSLNQASLHTVGPPPLPDNGLINGTMVNKNGTYHVTTVTQGKRYRLRFINTGVDNHFHVSIDGHNLIVITSDFVPIKPYVTESVSIAIGQRYDVIIQAHQPIGNYWLRANVATSCAKNANAGNIKSILRYEGAQISNPTTFNATAISTLCYDEKVTPYTSRTVPQDTFDQAMNHYSLDFNVAPLPNSVSLVQWLINGTDTTINWQHPTLENVYRNNFTFNPNASVFEITQPADAWTFWVIQTVLSDPVALAHPVHLHGHDFNILDSGVGIWNGTKSSLQFENPPRRDTATLPANGWLVLGFVNDNPGMWLLHCHVAWHAGAGFSQQFLERRGDIREHLGPGVEEYMEGTCAGWDAYWDSPGRAYGMEDSAL